MNERKWIWPLIAVGVAMMLLSTLGTGDWGGLVVPTLFGSGYYALVKLGERLHIPIGRARVDRALALVVMAVISVSSLLLVSSITWSLIVAGTAFLGTLTAIGIGRSRIHP